MPGLAGLWSPRWQFTRSCAIGTGYGIAGSSSLVFAQGRPEHKAAQSKRQSRVKRITALIFGSEGGSARE